MTIGRALRRRRRLARLVDRHRGAGRSRWLVALLLFAGLGAGLVVVLMGAGVGAAAGLFAAVGREISSPETLVTRPPSLSTQIYDRNGELLYEVFDPQGGRRSWVPLREMPLSLIQATIATEDASFYSNPGINVRGLLRALVQTSSGDIQGGSSITQQLVKSVLIPEEERQKRSLWRKVKEMVVAWQVTQSLSKDQILEMYLNEIFFGNISYGVESAAQSYFGKSVHDLSLAESAMLAGLPQAPSRYSPVLNPRLAKARQETVLDRMTSQGYLTPEEATAAKEAELSYAPARFNIRAPHFVVYVRDLLEQRLGYDRTYRGGLRVYTTLDVGIQEAAEAAAHEHIETLRRSVRATDAAVVVLRPESGEILAMVGSPDYFDASISGQINMAVAERQPGSSFKPITYVTAFEKGYAPATMLLDVRTSFPDGNNPPYVPKNVDEKLSGPISVRQALAMSKNIPAVRTIQFAGVQNVIDMAHRLGITGLMRQNFYGLSLTLGGGEVKLLDLAYAYSVFANGGVMAGRPVPPTETQPGMRTLEPVSILRIEGPDGRVIDEFLGPARQQVLSPQLAYLLTDILSDNNARAPLFGANSPLRLPDRPAAAKTGSTDDYRDAWTMGYTPDYVVGVWVGNADNRPMVKALSVTAAAPIWNRVMRLIHEGLPPRPFPVPEGLVRLAVCVPSGLLPNGICPTRTELFARGTEPRQVDNIHRRYEVDRRTGELANAGTPPEEIETRVGMALPPAAADWARENIPADLPPAGAEPAGGDVAVVRPGAGASVSGLVTVEGSARGAGFRQYRVEYGEGLQPATWLPIVPGNQSPVGAGRLGSWDTRNLNGIYSLRLTVQRGSGTEERLVPVTVDNAPPRARVDYPHPGEAVLVDPQGDREFGIQAAATDNGAIERAEIFVDGVSLGTTRVQPFNLPWKWVPGEHSAYAVAYDQAGNSSTSETVVFRVVAQRPS